MPNTITNSPPQIVLPRTYRPTGLLDSGDDWARDLWRLLSGTLSITLTVDALSETAVLEAMKQRLINYVYSRLVVGGCLAIETVYNVPDLRQEPLQEHVDDVLDVDAVTRDRIVWYLDRICPRIVSKANALSSIQIAKIRRVAAEHGHRCYICGRLLHFKTRPYGQDTWERIDEHRAKRSFEIDHMWNQARGGEKAPSNLAACCNECNKLKSDLLSAADLPLESHMGNPSDPESVAAFLRKELRFALMWAQGGRCATCETAFFELDEETLFVVRREVNAPHYFFNLMICCPKCNETKGLQGVAIREPLQRVPS